MAQIGLVPGQTFEITRFNASVQLAIVEGIKLALDVISAYKVAIGVDVHYWEILNTTGDYGTDYLKRAAVSYYGWGANEAADAIYPTTTVDSNNQNLVGTNQYVIHLAANQTPPVGGFWSFTMYDQDLFFVPNSLNRYSIESRDTLTYNSDGSLDLYLQYTSPGVSNQSNWLPAPEGNFTIMLRMYWPLVTIEEIVNGTWYIPFINQTTS